jgi:hypothetical protein
VLRRYTRSECLGRGDRCVRAAAPRP